jgi:hypothetical protein
MKLPSYDRRYKNAYDDIHCHTVSWFDNEIGWVWADRRFNLLHCSDEIYLSFLCDTLHPAVRSDEDGFQQLLEIYNRRLAQDGYELYVSDYISTMPVYSFRRAATGSTLIESKKADIKKYLNTNYVNGKIKIMTDSINSNPDLAIGTSKELIETVCKSILINKGIAISSDWELHRLFKETIGKIDFVNTEGLDNPEQGKKSIVQFLGGLNSVIHGLAELRNSYGSGHGKPADFVQMDRRYVALLVSVVSDITFFLLSLTDGKTELSE